MTGPHDFPPLRFRDVIGGAFLVLVAWAAVVGFYTVGTWLVGR